MDALAQIALTLVPGLGPTTLRNLVGAYPKQDIFALPPSELCHFFGTHREVAQAIIDRTTMARAEQELAFCQRGGITPLFMTDERFPQRLNRNETADCPALLYVMGAANLNAERTVAVVGTRRATAYGCDATKLLVSQLQPLGTPIVSGLAYGIDTTAHTAALANGLPTVAVLGHGLDRIYPPENRKLAAEIVDHGGALVTEYPSGTAINPRYFPARNRIIAALADATVVMEAKDKGGALITAAIAASYEREVFALPGRIGDPYSSGTNGLIATNKALMLRSADDLAYQLGWPLQHTNKPAAKQGELFDTLQPAEQKLMDLLNQHHQLTLDDLVTLANMPLPKVAALMFNLEMRKKVHALPGRLYQPSL